MQTKIQDNKELIVELKVMMGAVREDLSEFKIDVKDSLRQMQKTINIATSNFATKDEMGDCKENFLRKEEFKFYKKFIDGLVATILISVLGAILTLVIKK